MTINEFIIKDFFSFAKEIIEQRNSLCMGSIDVNSFFREIPLKETISVCTKSTYNQNDTVEGFTKSESHLL